MVGVLSLDTLVSGFAFGLERIRVPARSCLLISLVCSGIFGGAFCLGQLSGGRIPAGAAELCSGGILMALGLLRMLDGVIDQALEAREHRGPLFRLMHLYADSREADQNRSRSISLGEAVPLAAALSLDGAAAGFGAGIQGGSLGLLLLLFSLGFNAAALALGVLAGERAAGQGNGWISKLSGLILMALGAAKLLPF